MDNMLNPVAADIDERPVQDSNSYIYPINVRALDKGYIVEVGCKSFAITSKTELIGLFSKYIHNPQETTALYHSNKLFINN
jgi:hypothetical protein